MNKLTFLPVGFLALTAAAVGTLWWWLGHPVEMPQAALGAGAGAKLDCVSYAPFRGAQNPLTPDTKVEPWQIDEDLTRLSSLTNCVRTYSIEHGLDKIPEIAQRHGMKVLHGLWLSNHADLNRNQIDTTIALAKRFPDVIAAVIVGNEVLLRGEMSAPDLANTIRSVKAQVSMPVTYADVWEFWLRYREVADAVDYISIHILPYWEDFPISVRDAPAHVEAIREQMVAAFPNKEVFVGEVGWPSAGRMREGALPSPSNQARFVQEVVAGAKRENYRVNVIEAFDQPWKRALEGTVGGHWGLFDAWTREAKFAWGEPVSDHPFWRWQAAGGAAFAGVIFAVALAARRRSKLPPTPRFWAGVAAIATVTGTLIGWSIENVPLESLGVGGWTRSLALVALAFAAPLVGVAALASNLACPTFARVLGRGSNRPRDRLALACGVLMIAVTLMAIQAALELVFDPRYRDFPFAPLSAATVPFLVLSLAGPRRAGFAQAAEQVAAATLVLSAIYIAFNETLANWQALWFAAVLLVLAITLLRVRDAPG